MKYFAPQTGGATAEYWRAAAEGRLALPYCPACASFHWPPRSACPQCRRSYEWRTAGGSARLASWTIVRRAPQPTLRDHVPYVLGFVELDEGVRLFSHIDCPDPSTLRSGLRMRCEMRQSLDPAIHVPIFVVEGN